jgi:hypothetical protein
MGLLPYVDDYRLIDEEAANTSIIDWHSRPPNARPKIG